MPLKEKILNKFGIATTRQVEQASQVKQEGSYGYGYSYGYNTPIVVAPYTGEKNYGEMGAAIDNRPIYNILALRSWDAYVKSDIASSIMRNYILWSIGQGLILQSHPDDIVLKSEGINLTDEQLKEFTSVTDARFKIHSNSRRSTYSGIDTLHTLAAEVKKNSFISGDCLIVNRYNKKKGLNCELIDGLHVQSPPMNNNYHVQAKDRGNRIVHGVEINNKRTPIAYYVVEEGLKYRRIPARSRTINKTTAYLVYSNRYRVDYVRGMPMISCVLESLTKLDRYKEAAVGSAEEVAKIAYQIVHGASSTGKNPMANNIANAGLKGMKNAEPFQNFNSDELANKASATLGKMVINNTQDSKIEALEHKNELYFKEFWETNFNIICGALGIPPEIALGRYENNFSSSRMAGKSWEYAMKTDRKNFTHTFYKPYYNTWLYMEILTGKIKAPKYLESVMNENYMVIDSYENCRFIGASIPHVDPEKEVKAERLKLGDDTTPLTTHNQACEALNSGDFEENISRFKDEQDYVNKTLGIKTNSNE